MSKETKQLSPEEQLKGYLKDNKEDHYNFVDPTDYTISSGSLTLDIELGGGIKPSIVRSTGSTESGKTHNALAFMKNFLDKGEGYRGVYFKAEGRLDEEVQKRVGIEFSKNKDGSDWRDGGCHIHKSNIFEHVIGLMRTLVKNNPNKIKYFFIIDSMNALIPRGDEDKSFEEANKVAGGALLSSDFLRRMSLAFHELGHICFIINQVRSEVKINQYAKVDPKASNASGGFALEHFPDWIFEFQSKQSKAKTIFDSTGKKVIGHYCNIVLRKTTNEKTGRVVTYPIKHHQTNGESVWREYEVTDLLVTWDMVKKVGAWFKVNDEEKAAMTKINPDAPEQFHGLDKLRKFLEDNPKITDYYFNKFKNVLSKNVTA